MGIHRMNGSGTKFASTEWIKLLLALFGHAMLVFGALMYWANRIVIVETKVAIIEASTADMRADLKTILKHTDPRP